MKEKGERREKEKGKINIGRNEIENLNTSKPIFSMLSHLPDASKLKLMIRLIIKNIYL